MFITFEGIDGAGKSTQIERLRAYLLEAGHTVVCTREPGGTELGDRLREILLDPRETQLSSRTEALLYATSRAQLIYQVIRPALDAGHVVICDRFVDASIAYQGAGLQLGVEDVANLNAFATANLKPDVTFLFDIPVSVSQERVQVSRKGTPPDRIEQRDESYFNRVRDQFLSLAKADPERIVVIDATQSPEAVEQEIRRYVEKKIRNR